MLDDDEVRVGRVEIGRQAAQQGPQDLGEVAHDAHVGAAQPAIALPGRDVGHNDRSVRKAHSRACREMAPVVISQAVTSRAISQELALLQLMRFAPIKAPVQL